MAGIWIACSFFFFAVSRPQIFDSITFLGNSIKLRDVSDAINELRLRAKITASSTLHLLQTSNRMGGFDDDEKIEMYHGIENVLKAVGFEKEEIEDIQSKWHDWVRLDYVHAIAGGVRTNHPFVPSSNMEIWYQERDTILDNAFKIRPNELRKKFEDLGALTELMEELIGDFEYYCKTKKHKDYSKWKDRHTWLRSP